MNAIYSFLKSDRLILMSFFISLSCIGITLVFVIFSFHKLPPYIPLYNQLPWGEARLGQKGFIFAPLMLDIATCILNFALAKILYKRIPFISRILALTTSVVSFFVLLFIARIIYIIA